MRKRAKGGFCYVVVPCVLVSAAAFNAVHLKLVARSRASLGLRARRRTARHEGEGAKPRRDRGELEPLHHHRLQAQWQWPTPVISGGGNSSIRELLSPAYTMGQQQWGRRTTGGAVALLLGIRLAGRLYCCLAACWISSTTSRLNKPVIFLSRPGQWQSSIRNWAANTWQPTACSQEEGAIKPAQMRGALSTWHKPVRLSV